MNLMDLIERVTTGWMELKMTMMVKRRKATTNKWGAG